MTVLAETDGLMTEAERKILNAAVAGVYRKLENLNLSPPTEDEVCTILASRLGKPVVCDECGLFKFEDAVPAVQRR